MFWIDEILTNIDKTIPHILTDSKTPSGEPHIGSLRGVLIHDAIYKTLEKNGVAVKYYFGSDDYDPLDEIPKGQDEHFEKYLGQPLCNVPAPAGSTYPDMAEHFIFGFFDIFKKVGATPDLYRMRDLYRTGKLNETIERILSRNDTVRDIYKSVSGSTKSSKWYPFQSICENCGRIGTTEVIDFNGKEVTYICRPNLVKWAKGCGHTGSQSPFDGKGKLPWKLEWVAKWVHFKTTIEGAGMDHSTKGGSREVAGEIYKTVFQKIAPYNVPYGFFLVGGAKMSSSKGIGSTAKEMSKFLAPDILRYLMLSTPPLRAINFENSEKYISKLHSDFDTIKLESNSPSSETALQQRIFWLSDPTCIETNYFNQSFSNLKTLIQIQHINIYTHAAEEKGQALTEFEIQKLKERIQSVKYWLDHYAGDDEIFVLQDTLSEKFYHTATIIQQGFLYYLLQKISTTEWNAETLQSLIFNVARTTPLSSKDAFKSIYLAFLNQDKGPIAGNLLFHLGKEKVINVLQTLSLPAEKFYQSFSSDEAVIFTALEKIKNDIVSISVNIHDYSSFESIDALITTNDAKEHRYIHNVSSKENKYRIVSELKKLS